MPVRRTARSRALAFLALTPLVACGGGGGDGEGGGGPSGPAEQVIFSSRRTGILKLYTMTPTGGSQVAITTGAGDDIAATVSPDGERVAFLTKRYSLLNQVAVLELATGAVTRVLVDTVAHGAPSWSPDGEWIAFNRSWNCSCHPSIWKVRPSGADLTPLGASTNGHSPAWSPTGDRLVYVGTNSLRLIDSSGANDTLLIGLSAGAERPAWSGTAAVIAFRGPGGILLVGPNGSGLDTVVTPGHQMANIAWSDDGIWLYGTTNIDNTGTAPNYEIARFHADGSNWTRITVNGDGSGGPVDDWPAWAPVSED